MRRIKLNLYNLILAGPLRGYNYFFHIKTYSASVRMNIVIDLTNVSDFVTCSVNFCCVKSNYIGRDTNEIIIA